MVELSTYTTLINAQPGVIVVGMVMVPLAVPSEPPTEPAGTPYPLE